MAVVWGTVFTLYFPRTEDVLEKASEAIPHETYMGHGQTIIVIDDQKGQRDLAVNMLERLGYKAQVAAGGEEALAYLAGAKADLVLLDMTIKPGMDGLVMYRKVLNTYQEQKAVIVSGYLEAEQMDQARTEGIRIFVRKLYNMEDIGLAVKEALTR